jgi:hypothetical protein
MQDEMAGGRSLHGVLAGAGGPGLLVLLLAMEAEVPVPVPSDLVMLLGERVSAGTLPLWLAAAALELVALAATATLSLAARGPGRALLSRVAPRIGLTGAGPHPPGSRRTHPVLGRVPRWGSVAQRRMGGVRLSTASIGG